MQSQEVVIKIAAVSLRQQSNKSSCIIVRKEHKKGKEGSLAHQIFVAKGRGKKGIGGERATGNLKFE